MNGLYVKLTGLTLAALPLLDIDILDYVRSLEFRAMLSQYVLTPLLTGLSDAAVLALMNRLFGVI